MSDSTDYQYWVDQGEEYCYLPSELTDADPVHGNLTLKTIMIIIGAVLSGVTLILALTNAFRHLRNYTCPQEQRQIVRIIFTPFFFCLFYWLSICFYDASYYLEPIATIWEAICMVGVFLLFVAMIVPDAEHKENIDRYFNDLQRVTRKGKPKSDKGSLRWFYVIWILIFQVVVCRIGYNIAEWVFWAQACPLDDEPTSLQVIQPVFMALWVVGLLTFYGRMKPQLKERNAFFKAVCFKTIVLLQIIQTPIFDNLLSNGTITPSSTMSYRDLQVGIPALVVCVEMIVFGLVFLFAYSIKDYKAPSSGKLEANLLKQPLPFGKAFIDVLNMRDIIGGLDIWRKLPVIFGKKPNLPPPQQQQAQLSADQEHLWQQGNNRGNSPAGGYSPDARYSEGGYSGTSTYNTPPQNYSQQPYRY